jgi:RNA polymerase sigma factor (sigma-70 family)
VAHMVQDVQLNVSPLKIRRARYRDMTDAELVLACQQHDREAFDCLAKRHQRTILSLVYKMAPEIQDPSDLAQEVLIRVWRYIGTLRDPEAFRSWLKRIATNVFYDQLRQRPKQSILSLDDPMDASDGSEREPKQIADLSARPDELMERRQLGDEIKSAISKLSRQSRIMIELRDIRGLSYDQIAEITKCPLGTVKSRIARSRLKLQAMLMPQMEASA